MGNWKGIVGESFSLAEFDRYVAGLAFVSWRPSFVVLHNTASPKLSQWHSVPGEQRMRNLEHYYRDTQHWSAGPHLFVADDKIWVFTPLTVKGVHSPSWNAISWGVEMVGDYGHEALNPEVYENTISALVTLHAKLGLDSHTLRFHKEDPATTHNCPGKNVHKDKVIADLHNRLVARYEGDHLPDRPG